MPIQTCKWCGKQFDSSRACSGGVNRNYWYCSKKCENAGESAREKEHQRDKENFKRVFGQNSYDNLRSFLILAILGGLIFVIIAAWIGSITDKKTEVQETVNVQQQTEEVINQLEQITPVVNQSESSDIGEEVDDNWMPEPLEMPDRRTEVVEDDDIIESDEIELEEEIKLDYSSQKVYDLVDEMPVFPNGDHELMKYIAENLEYPQEAIDGDVQGTVFVKIIVEPDGSVSNAKIIRGIGYGCDEEAIRVIESMPNWEPGHKKGEAVRVYMAVPVSFKLQ